MSALSDLLSGPGAIDNAAFRHEAGWTHLDLMPWKNPHLFRFDLSHVALHPAAAGVYGIFAESGWVYFGESEDLQRRLGQHLWDTAHCVHRYGPLHFSVEVTDRRAARQQELIREFAPPCNQPI
jgi:hypothetical protein